MREVLYKVFVQEQYFSAKKEDEMSLQKQKLTKERALCLFYDCINNHGTCYLMADFGAYFTSTGNLNSLSGVIILAKVINGVLQEMPKYNLISAMCADELEEKSGSKENYKMHLTPEELVEEIRKSFNKFFCFYPDDIRFASKYPSQTIDADSLDPEYKVKDFYEVVERS